MPILGIGLHLIVAIFFAVHAVRTRRQQYWLPILFMFPLLGSIVYFAAVFLPHSRIERGLRRTGAAIGQRLDPGREMRAARAAFDLAPTAHNQMQLAAALFEAGEFAQAVQQYDACLRGPFAGDAEIALGAARAKLANGEAPAALAVLQDLRARIPNFRPEQVGLVLGDALEAAGRSDEAGDQFDAMVQRHASVETRAALALWALAHGRRAIAERELKELDHARRHMTSYTRDLHRDLFSRIDAARA